ncbi:MAG TPA: hypothetical protein VH639_13800 [Bryobacteraceae bacterium]|jgi:hypothetical protein
MAGHFLSSLPGLRAGPQASRFASSQDEPEQARQLLNVFKTALRGIGRFRTVDSMHELSDCHRREREIDRAMFGENGWMNPEIGCLFRSAPITASASSINRRRRIPWLALMSCDAFFEVAAEIPIQRNRRVPLLGFPEDFLPPVSCIIPYPMRD